ncbi:hypothetical protein Tco_0699401, partial [Tanacetum coccineum]
VLDGNYSSTEQVNSIQQLIAYCLLTGIKIDIGEIIYIDLVTRLTNKSRKKYVSYPRFVSCALAVLLGSDYTQDESFGSSPTIPRVNVQPINKGLPSTVSDEGTVKTTPLPEGLHMDKDSEIFKPPADMEPLTTPVADPTRIDTRFSDVDDVLEAGEEIDEDIPPTDEEAQSLPPNQEQP